MRYKFLPFLQWFKDYSTAKLRIDFLAGLTVALVLIPQSMAYAQLAGLPAYYGLYAAFLPPMVASLFGSSRQLATGPVAVVSLMTAACLEPLASAGSEAFIAYSIMLAFTVGMFQFLLGVLRLGLIVNFLSHPVVNGFTNAAAIIIASSQLSKMFGVYVDKAPHHYETIIRVFEAAVDYTHWPTLAMGAASIALMAGLKRLNPKIPYVLVAVVIATLISWTTGFEHNKLLTPTQIGSQKIQAQIQTFNLTLNSISRLADERSQATSGLEAARSHKAPRTEVLTLEYRVNELTARINSLKHEASSIRTGLRSHKFAAFKDGDSLAFLENTSGTTLTALDDRVYRWSRRN